MAVYGSAQRLLRPLPPRKARRPAGRCRNKSRRQPGHRAAAGGHSPDIAQLLVDKDAAFTVHQCLHALEEPYKEVFSLRVFGELPFDRIGAIFGHNAAWARVTYYRAKTRIQTMLEQRK